MFLSTFVVKLLGAALSILVVRFVDQYEFGLITFAMAIISSASPFSGFGGNWSLLRYGPVQIGLMDKSRLFLISLIDGTKKTFFVVLLILAGSFFIPDEYKGASIFLIILSFSLFTNYFYENFKSYLRIISRNKAYSYSNVIGSLALFLVGVPLCFLFGGYGYTIALVLAPMFAFLFFLKRVRLNTSYREKQVPKGFWNYGLSTGFGSIANQMVFTLGPIIPAYLAAGPDEVALFKVATIIPFNLMLIPLMILTTDFVHLSKSFESRQELAKYYKGYVKTIVMVSLPMFTCLMLLNEWLITLLFGQDYSGSVPLVNALYIGLMFSFVFRIPLGNILAAVGKANWNVINSIVWLILFIPMSIMGYLNFGIAGIAYSTSAVFILSGFVSLILFLIYLKNLSNNSYE